MKSRNGIVVLLLVSFSLCILVLSLNVMLVSVGGIHFNSGVNIRNYANNISLHTEVLTARRGFIYDRNKEIVAQDVDHYNLYAVLNPDIPSLPGVIAYVDDKEKTAELLAPILNMTYEECFGYLNVDSYQVEFGSKGRSLTQLKKDEIEALHLNGLGFIKNSGRIYPNGVFASHLIGFAQYDVDSKKMIGKMGLEASLDGYLQGKDGFVEYQKDTNGFILPGTTRNEQFPVNGNDVYLTLDATVQMYVEDGLEATIEKFQPKATWAVIMEVKTGKILGYASYPSFDPNVKDIASYIDVPIAYAFEPGSTMKAFLYAAAMNENKYNPNLLIKTGLFHVGIRNGVFVRLNSKSEKGYIGTVQDFNKGVGWGDISVEDGMIRSSNTVMVSELINAVTPTTYRDYLDRFGFFKRVDFDAVGQNGSINFTYGMEKITAAYGQGLTVNTIQLMQAYTAIFGNGDMLRPYVVDSIKNPYTEEVLYQAKKTVVGSPITEATAKQMQALLTEVVEDAEIGSARFYRIPEVKMAGKTGTAEISGQGEYLSGAGNNLYSFVVAAPAEDPQIMMFYGIQQPNTKSVHDNTDVFKTMFRNTLLYLNIHGDSDEVKNEEDKTVLYEQKPLASFVNQSVVEAKQALNEDGFEVFVIGDGSSVVRQFPAVSGGILTSQKVFLFTGSHKILMPDMTGWSRKDVLAFWNLCGISVESSGDGYVVDQNIDPGDVITVDDHIQVLFEG